MSNSSNQAVILCGGFQALELAIKFDEKNRPKDSLDNLKTLLATSVLPLYQNVPLFKILSLVYYRAFRVNFNFPLAYATFLTKYGSLSIKRECMIAHGALMQSSCPDTSTIEFGGMYCKER